METQTWIYNDGGRQDAGFTGKTGDCVTRSISIALNKPYKEVYDKINELSTSERTGKRKRGVSNARKGVYKTTINKILKDYGMTFTPLMSIGSGCTTHLKKEELPAGRIICSCSRHYVAVIDGIINDTSDCSRNGTRCVYGYWSIKC